MSDDGPGSDAGAGDEEAVGDDSADGVVCAMRGHAVAAVAMTSSPHSAGSTGTARTSTTGLCLFDWPEDTSARRFTTAGVDMLSTGTVAGVFRVGYGGRGAAERRRRNWKTVVPLFPTGQRAGCRRYAPALSSMLISPGCFVWAACFGLACQAIGLQVHQPTQRAKGPGRAGTSSRDPAVVVEGHSMSRRRATPRVVCDSSRALEALSRLGVADALVPNATERLRRHPLAMPERLCRAGAQGLPNAHFAHQLPETRLMVMTSLAVGGLDRSQWFAANRRVVPSLLAFEAVDGNDPAKTLARLNALGVPFGRLCDRYASWGMLACTVTHIAAFERQVAEGVPLMVVLEDDVALGRDFPEHIGRLAAMHLLGNGSLLRRKARRRLPADLVQLGACTEGYIVSLRAATRLLDAYRKHGLRGCADQQLNDPRWQELAGVRAVRATQRVPWVSLAPTNDGDISRTPCISRSDHQLLRWLGRGSRRPHGLRVNATALALAPAQRKRGYCKSFDNVTRSGVRHRYKPARDYLYVAPEVHGKVP